MVKIILLIVLILLIVFIIKKIKPYTLKYDTILSFIGGNGSGKTLTGVKTANTMITKARISWWFAYRKERRQNRKIKKYNKKAKIYNEQAKQFNANCLDKESKIPYKQYKKLVDIPLKPQIYSTIPVYFKCFFWNKREYSCKFLLSHALCLQPIAQWSIIILDELPQFVNQYNWELPEVQNEFAEFCTMFRHYYDGHVIITSQASQEIVAQIRRKMNIATWCFNFRKPIWPLSKWFYKMSCCDLMLNDSVSVNASTLVEENTKTFWGKFPRKNTYDSRCYSERIKNMLYGLDKNPIRFDSLKTNDIIRFDSDLISMLDDSTTTEQKEEVAKKFKIPTKKPNMTTNILREIVKIEQRQKGATWEVRQ